MVGEMRVTEEFREWLTVSVKHNCLTGTGDLYNLLLLGTVNDTKDLTVSPVDLEPGG